jgi:hypothetical protein
MNRNIDAEQIEQLSHGLHAILHNRGPLAYRDDDKRPRRAPEPRRLNIALAVEFFSWSGRAPVSVVITVSRNPSWRERLRAAWSSACTNRLAPVVVRHSARSAHDAHHRRQLPAHESRIPVLRLHRRPGMSTPRAREKPPFANMDNAAGRDRQRPAARLPPSPARRQRDAGVSASGR